MQHAEAHATWSSRLVFLMAAVGAAVGLGNVWKFPYTAGVSGGGAFVLVYIASIAAVAAPIVMAELLIGRRGRRSPVNSFRELARRAGASTAWRFVGVINVTAVFLILTFYSVIAGWALAYVPKVMTGAFAGLGSEGVDQEFSALLASPSTMILWHGIFMILTVAIVARGVQAGIEKAVKFLMPSLFAMLLVLVGYGAVAGDFSAAMDFMFSADFSKLNAEVVLAAIGQAFFSVSVAMGLMIAYGAYLPDNVRIPRASFIIAGADTLVALLAGLAIFPLVFANGLDPGEGPGLIFVTLPIAFGSMPAGTLFGTIFFLLLIFAAITSSIAIMEPIVSWADEQTALTRGPAAMLIGAAAWLIGLLTVFSFNLWSGVHPLGMFKTFEGKTIFDLIDYLTSNIMLPLGGILIAVFVGWILSRSDTMDELGLSDGIGFRAWQFIMRFLAPLLVGAVLVSNLA